MRFAIAQLNYHVGNFEFNTTKIISTLEEAKKQGIDLVIFAEMAISGYPARDWWLHPDFQQEAEAALQRIATHCIGISCIIGTARKNSGPYGKPLKNVAVLLADGQIKDYAQKGLIPNYDVFEEFRYFQPASQFHCLEVQGKKLAVTVCEDLWNLQHPALYSSANDPNAILAAEQPDLCINIAASPFSKGHFERRINVLQTHATQSGCAMVYVNQVGAHAELIFDGRSVICNADGTLVDELAAFEEDFRVYDLLPNKSIQPVLSNSFANKQPSLESNSTMALVHRALVLGIRDFFAKSGFKKAVLGLSGGLDSAVVAVLACDALGAENVLGVLMPSQYSSDHSIKDAEELVKLNGCQSLTLPIHGPTQAFYDVLSGPFAGATPDTTEENIQARTRGVLLMAISNKWGHVLLNTSNKSEAAVGYGTLYGDMAGSLSVIGDLFKTEVYQLAEYLNKDSIRVPINTIQKPPSAELRPDQKDSDSLPDYSLLDQILQAFIVEQQPVTTIKEQVGEDALVDRILKMVERAEFKRFQAPPILRVSRKAFGPGRLIPLVAKWKG